MEREHSRFESWRTSFDGAVPADDDDALRPSYPAEAVAWATGEPDRACDVLDLGAGTGILGSVLVALGHRVTAVDPSGPMLTALRRRLPDVDVRVGTGKRGLPGPPALSEAADDITGCVRPVHLAITQ